MTRIAATLACFFLLSACGFQAIGDLRNDNPGIREQQRASVARYPEKPIRGQGIEEFFSGRVGLVHTASNSQGRAVPLTHDGYYLTAWHVVRGEDGFWLSDTVLLKPFPEGGGPVKASDHIRTDLHGGRLVWHDPEADLAIIKFDFRPAQPFAVRAGGVDAGSAVFSGASGSNSGTLLVKPGDGLEDGFGNGPFQTAGRITQTGRFGNDSRCLWFRSTLVSRRGMSGGPVVDSEGELVGIVTRTGVHLPGALSRDQSVFATVSAMVPGRDIERIIAADRAR